MKVNTVDLLNALTKVNGIVGDKSVVEDLRSFHMLPEGDVLKIGGTDSNMMLVESVTIEPTEASDGSLLVVSVGKILDILRYAGHEVEFEYTSDSEEVNIITPRSKVTLKKHQGITEGVIDFDLDQEDDFKDTFKVSELKKVFNSLSSIIDSTETDPSAKTLFFTGDRAIVGDDLSLSVMNIQSNDEYEFQLKVVKQILSLISSLGPDDEIKIKKINKGERVLVKTPVELFSFGSLGVLVPETDSIDDFERHAAVVVSKEELIRSINLVRATSEEDIIFTEISENMIEFSSYYEGENARDELSVIQGKITDRIVGGKVQIDPLASQLLKLISVIDDEVVIISIDTESLILTIRDKGVTTVSALIINIVSN